MPVQSLASDPVLRKALPPHSPRMGVPTPAPAPGPAPWLCVAAVLEQDKEQGMGSHMMNALNQLMWCEGQPGAVPTVWWNSCPACSHDSTVNSWEWWFEPTGGAQAAALLERARRKQASAKTRIGGKRAAAAAPGGAGGAGGLLCPAWTAANFPSELQGLRMGREPPARGKAVGDDTDWEKLFPGTGVRDMRPVPFLSTSFGVHREANSYTAASMTPTRRKLAHRLLAQYVRPRADALGALLAEFEAAHFAGRSLVIAVHVRATDHVFEFKADTMVFLAAYFKAVDALLAQHAAEHAGKIVSIFVASDNQEAVNGFVKRYGQRGNVEVCFSPAPRAEKFDSFGWVSGEDDAKKRQVGTGIFQDAWLMSKAHHLVHWDSAVVKLAAMLNPELVSHYLPGPDEKTDDGKQMTAAAVQKIMQLREQREQGALRWAAGLPRCAAPADCPRARELCTKHFVGVGPVEGRCMPVDEGNERNLRNIFLDNEANVRDAYVGTIEEQLRAVRRAVPSLDPEADTANLQTAPDKVAFKPPSAQDFKDMAMDGPATLFRVFTIDEHYAKFAQVKRDTDAWGMRNKISLLEGKGRIAPLPEPTTKLDKWVWEVLGMLAQLGAYPPYMDAAEYPAFCPGGTQQTFCGTEVCAKGNGHVSLSRSNGWVPLVCKYLKELPGVVRTQHLHYAMGDGPLAAALKDSPGYTVDNFTRQCKATGVFSPDE
jgi:hypothetical protein